MRKIAFVLLLTLLVAHVSSAEAGCQIKPATKGEEKIDPAWLAENLKIAESNLRQAKKDFGSQHLRVVESLHNLAELLSLSGRYKEAEPLAQRAVRTALKLKGPIAWTSGIMLKQLGDIYCERGDLANAKRAIERALLASRTFLALDAYAGVLRRIGQNERAGVIEYRANRLRKESPSFDLWRSLAERGDDEAQFQMGVIYEDGRGVTRDDTEAARWYRRAAEQGYARAQFLLAELYHAGRGVPHDDHQSLGWARRAAEQGYALAQYGVGKVYYNGWGVDQDRHKAARWFRLAANQGFAEAQNTLGSMHSSGELRPKDIIEAYKWWSLASLQGNEDAIRNLSAFGSMMTEAQVRAAEKLAHDWFPRLRDIGLE